MFDFDLVAIGFEYVGILHGHCFPALAKVAKSSTAFPWTHMVFLSFPGTTASETLEATLLSFFFHFSSISSPNTLAQQNHY